MHSDKSGGFGSIPRATGGIARLACRRLQRENKNDKAVLSRAGLAPEDIEDRSRWLEVGAQIRVLDFAADELKDEYLGFHLAREFELGEIGLLYYVMASSKHLTQALQNAERYSAVVNEGVRLRLDTNPETVIALDYVGVDRQSDRHQIEFWLVALVRICRALTDNRLAPRRMKVRHIRPRTPAEFKSFLGCDIEFGSDGDEIVFPSSVAGLPVVGDDPHLNELLRRYADDALGPRPAQNKSVRSRIEDLVVLLLPHGRAKLPEVARELGMSERTLGRSLRLEGTSFSEVLEQLRIALAKRYLEDDGLPISQIAWLLGYQEISSFTHAFRRWTTMTPRRFRSAMGSADQPA
jgi:AraC-like DNA-binding protein